MAAGFSTDGSLEELERWSEYDSRLRIVSRSYTVPADVSNKSLTAVCKTLIDWLNADDLYLPGGLPRAIATLESHLDWLMVHS